MEKRKASVIMVKCPSAKKSFGIRMEQISNVWHCTWAFKLSEKAAKNEGYDEEKVSGRIDIDDEYPGCPYCGTRGWFSCGKCNRLNCYTGGTNVVCAWCGAKSRVVSADTFDLKGGGY